MEGISLQEIIQTLLPQSEFLIWDIFLYIIFFLSLITLFMQSDKQILPTLLMAAVLLLTLIAKLSISRQIPFQRREFAMLIVNCGIFIFPALVAGMTKAKKSRGPAVLAGLIGFVFMFLYWLIFQR